MSSNYSNPLSEFGATPSEGGYSSFSADPHVANQSNQAASTCGNAIAGQAGAAIASQPSVTGPAPSPNPRTGYEPSTPGVGPSNAALSLGNAVSVPVTPPSVDAPPPSTRAVLESGRKVYSNVAEKVKILNFMAKSALPSMQGGLTPATTLICNAVAKQVRDFRPSIGELEVEDEEFGEHCRPEKMAIVSGSTIASMRTSLSKWRKELRLSGEPLEVQDRNAFIPDLGLNALPIPNALFHFDCAVWGYYKAKRETTVTSSDKKGKTESKIKASIVKKKDVHAQKNATFAANKKKREAARAEKQKAVSDRAVKNTNSISEIATATGKIGVAINAIAGAFADMTGSRKAQEELTKLKIAEMKSKK